MATALPDDFVYLSDVCPSIIQNVGYITKENFVSDGTVDMGVGFDFLHEASWADVDYINEECRKNKQILKDVMLRCGFKPYGQTT
ncbi:MAG: hypothetical protein LBF42_00220 [Puniceicoccales bacterium]|nr:hypothetical protein [Puniceicoccales bacterium]